MFRTPLASQDVRDWVDAQFNWRINHPTLENWRDNVKLVSTDVAYSRKPEQTDKDFARQLFDFVKSVLKIEDDIAFEPMDTIPFEYRSSLETTSVAGLYYPDNAAPIIQYEPQNVDRPLMLLDTIAHELMHHKLAPYINETPGGADAHELTTDLQCIVHGFGLVQLEGAAIAGWSGYISQHTRAYALAIFSDKLSIDPKIISMRLNGQNRRLFKKATKHTGQS